MAKNAELPRNAILRGGIAGGGIAGSVMLAFAVIYAGMTGAGFSTPLRLIAAAINDVPALIEAGEAVAAPSTMVILLMGAIIHFTFAAGWGIVFVRLFPRLSGGAALGVGLLYGLAVWALMTWGVLIWVDRPMYDRVRLAGGAFLFEHLLYGGFVALAPGLARRYPGNVPGDPIRALRLN